MDIYGLGRAVTLPAYGQLWGYSGVNGHRRFIYVGTKL